MNFLEDGHPYLYGKLNKEVEFVKVKGKETPTTVTEVDEQNNIGVQVKDSIIVGGAYINDSNELIIESRDERVDPLAVVQLGNFQQEQSDMAMEDESNETFIKNKSTKYLKNEGEDGTSPYTTEHDLESSFSNLNIKNGLGEGSLQQKQDGTTGIFDFTGKNPNATALDPTLTGQIAYGGVGDFSTALGGKSSAQGKRSFAAGTTTIAKGKYSAAFGDNSVTLGNDSAAFGYSTVAQGLASFTAGVESITKDTEWTKPSSGSGADNPGSGTEAPETNVRGQGAVALGVRTLSSGYGSLAAGVGTVSNGTGSFSIGVNTVAKETGSVAIGSNTESNSINTYAGGKDTVTQGSNSFAHGVGLKTSRDSEAAFGKYNDTGDRGSYALTVGIGTSDTDRKNGFIVSDGGVGYLEAYSATEKAIIRTKELTAAISEVEAKFSNYFNKRGDAGEQKVFAPVTTFTQKVYVNNPPKEANEVVRKEELDAQSTTLTKKINDGLDLKLDKAGGIISGSLIIDKDLTVNGTQHINNTENLDVKNAMIYSNSDGATLASNGGLGIKTNSTDVYGIVYDPVGDSVKLGLGKSDTNGKFTFNANEGNPIAVRDDDSKLTNDKLLKWNSTNRKLVDSGKSVDDLSTATNLENGTGVNAVQQKKDTGYTGVAIKTKNPNAYALDNTLTDNESIGGIGDYASSFGGVSSAQGKRSHAEGTNTVAKGKYSHAEGDNSVALGNDSHAEGGTTVAKGLASHSEGQQTQAIGASSHSEGLLTKSLGTNSHAEGSNSETVGNNSHAEGTQTIAQGYSSHSEGNISKSIGDNSHSEGYNNQSVGTNSHAEGSDTIANGLNAHTEGWLSKADGDFSHVEGYKSSVKKTQYVVPEGTGGGSGVTGDAGDSGSDWVMDDHRGEGSHAEGILTQSSGYVSHSEGLRTVADGHYSHAEGQSTYTKGLASHAEGNKSTALGYAAHAEGNTTKASGNSSHSEGYETTSSGEYSHAEGSDTIASGDGSHAEGNLSNASGIFSHAEGKETVASNTFSHAEGFGSTASGNTSHAEGSRSVASGQSSHAEGNSTQAIGGAAHAEGIQTTASHDGSHSEGYQTRTSAINQHVGGQCNADNENALLIIGNGSSDTDRKNAFTVFADGRAKVQSAPIDNDDVVRKLELDSLINRVKAIEDLLGQEGYEALLVKIQEGNN